MGVCCDTFFSAGYQGQWGVEALLHKLDSSTIAATGLWVLDVQEAVIEAMNAMFRKDIEGLRSIAVLLVILFHARFELVKGGYIGVDVFFVISGYLITLGLLKSNRVDFASFYARRVRRLFPALITTILLTFSAAYFLMGRYDFASTAKSTIYALISFSNMGFWFETGYWDKDAHFKPLLHTWSLSVEEQFYLFWPLLVAFSLSLKGPVRVLLFFLPIPVGLVIAQLYIGYDSAAVFYLTPFRIYQFSIGGTLAALIHLKGADRLLKSKMVNELLVLSGLAMIIIPALIFDGTATYLGALAAIPCLGAAFLIGAGRSKVAELALENPVSSYIGRISYSLYLVHWPLFSLYGYYTLRDFSFNEQVALILLTFVLGMVLYHFVEKRCRWQSSRSWFNGLGKAQFSLAMALATIAGTVIAAHAWNSGVHIQSQRSGDVDSLLDRSLSEEQVSRYSLLPRRCFSDRISCFRSDPRKKNIVILGDSHGIDAYNIMKSMFGSAHIVLGATNGCDAFVNASGLYNSEQDRHRCNSDNDKIFNSLSLFKNADLIVFNAHFLPASISLLQETVEYLRSVSDAEIALFSVSPSYTIPLPLIVRKEKLSFSERKVPSEYLIPSYWEVNESLEKLAKSENLIFINKADYFCPQKTCLALVGDDPSALASYDKHHLSFEASLDYSSYLKSMVLNKKLSFGGLDKNLTEESPAVSSLSGDENVVFSSLDPDNWKAINATIYRTDEGLVADFQPHGEILAFNPKVSVNAGERYFARVKVHLSRPASFAFRVARYCGKGESEQTVMRHNLSQGEYDLEVGHSFAGDQGCARLTFSALHEPLSMTIKYVELDRET